MHPSEIPLNVLAEAAGDGVILIDDQSTILFVNPAAGQIFGYERAEMVGDNLISLMPEYLRQIHLTSLKRYIATGQRHISWQNVQLTGLHKSGREFPIEVSFTEYTSQGRRFFTGFVRDVTERKQVKRFGKRTSFMKAWNERSSDFEPGSTRPISRRMSRTERSARR